MKHLLIAGRPGAGKTTLMKRLTEHLRGQSIDGFLTEELREGETRLGFWLSSLDGRQVLLAHRTMDSPYRVGPYRVNVTVLDELAVGILRRAIQRAELLFIDEIGKMELCSRPFQRALEDALARGPRMVATVGVSHLKFVDRLKHRHDVELIPLSSGNWKAVYEELQVRLTSLCDADHELQRVHRQADRICEMIVEEDAPAIDIEIQQAQLREMVAHVFPDKPAFYYHLLCENRFRRLWQQFR